MQANKSVGFKQSATCKQRPRLAVTLGDPAGIGPEVVLKALSDPDIVQGCDVTVLGGRCHLQQLYDRLDKSLHRLLNLDDLNIIDLELEVDDQIRLGTGNAASGAASFAYLEAAIDHTLAGEFDAIVTGPIAKSAWAAAGYYYPGQTELLAQKSGCDQYGMLFVARSPHTSWMLRTLLATTHIPLRKVADSLTAALMTDKLALLLSCLKQDFGLTTPHISIAGLNPHSGEQGQLGHEEQDWLIPWLETMRMSHPAVKLAGPVPPDTLWVKAGQAWYGSQAQSTGSGMIHSPSDAYLALYHDQGLIPVKLMAFDRAVNTSIGLPFVRTSPDHGTAFDIAGQGIADASSMKAALNLAIEIVQHRLCADS